MSVEIIEGGDTVTVVIEVDTSAFEAAFGAPQPPLRTLSDAFADCVEAVSQPFELTADDVLRAFADLP